MAFPGSTEDREGNSLRPTRENGSEGLTYILAAGQGGACPLHTRTGDGMGQSRTE